MQISLKAARVNANLTQAEAAKALKTNIQSLVNYESGKVMPNVEMVKRMMDVYGIPFDEINFYPEITV